ncbi:MAG: hypothetical protein JNK82_00585 [Myxococcaceae bacterium]|nr:hypothetical protein [Myxococcaceae bacterium]
MWLTSRKTATRVRDGEVQRKNRHGRTPWSSAFIVREAPREGSRHVLTARHVRDFLELLPAELLEGIDQVLLDRATHLLGWCRHGIVALCAWPRELWTVWPADWLDDHRTSLELYGVPIVLQHGWFRCEFTEPQVRAFQLLRVLTHELGHHADLMATRSKRFGHGERHAERFAIDWEQRLWADYVDVFGWP